MKNLFNSPFEYWEKIGYVGYNNYTDLHLQLKKDIIFKEWKNNDATSLMSNKLLYSHYNLDSNPRIKNINTYSKNKFKNTKKFKFFCIFNSFVFLIRKANSFRCNYIKILHFISNWKKIKYKSLYKLKKKNINLILFKEYLKTINKIYKFYFKVLYFIYKKHVSVLKTKLYRYLKYFLKFKFLNKKKKQLYTFIKYFIKNIYNIYKNPNIISKINKLLSINKDLVLYDESPLNVFNNNYFEYNNTKLFRNIPKNHNKNKKLIKFFILNYLNIDLITLKSILKKNKYIDWSDLLALSNNNLSFVLSSMNITTIRNIMLNGSYINNNNSYIHLLQGDLLEYDFNNTNDISYWLNKKLLLFFLLILSVTNNNNSYIFKLYVNNIIRA